jgi:hypothetical protein
MYYRRVADTFSPSAKLNAHTRLILIRVKIQRAKKHLTDLELLMAGFGDRNINVMIKKDDPQIPVYMPNQPVTLTQIPFEAVAAAGDVVQNLRSALDHLANQLWLVNRSTPTRHTEFPISKNFATYERNKTRKVEGMRTDAKEAIDRLKPYSGGNEPLWRLHELNNIDKHRLLFTVGRDIMFHAEWINHPWGADYNNFLMRASDPHFVGVLESDSENNIQLGVDETITEAEITQSYALLPSLHQLVNVVEDLILGFEPFLE